MYEDRINLCNYSYIGLGLPMNLKELSNSYTANKRGFVQILIPPSWGLSYQFAWHAINRSVVFFGHAPIRWYFLHKPDM